MSNSVGLLYLVEELERMPMRDFAGSLNDYLVQLQANCAVAARTSERFAKSSDIWPDQCLRVVRHVEPVLNSLQQLGQLIEHTHSVPLAVVPLRYDLIVKLGYLRRQLQRILTRASEVQSSCRSTARSAIMARQELQRQLLAVLPELDDLGREFAALLDRARFRELTI